MVINDVNPAVMARNLLLLAILNGEGDSKMNADIALHFWYSIFLPTEYATRLPWFLTPVVDQIKETRRFDFVAHNDSRICGDLGKDAFTQFIQYLRAPWFDSIKISAEFEGAM